VFLGAGRALDPQSFTDFAGVWGAIFGMAAVLGAIELEAARQAAAGQDTGPLTRTALLFGSVLALAGVLGAPLIATALQLSEPRVALAIPAALATYPLLFVVRGTLAGSDRLGAYAGITPLENAIRLGVAIPSMLSGTARFVSAIAIGPLAFTPWMSMISAPMKQRWSWTELRSQLGGIAPLLSGNLAGALLITGMPATAIIVLGDNDAVGISAAVALATISRVPLVLLNSVYGLLVPWFMRGGRFRTNHAVGRRVSFQVIVALIAVAAAILGLGGAITAIGARFMIDAPERIALGVALVYTAGAGCLGLIQVATARLVAAGRRGSVQTMWWSAAITAVAIMIVGRSTSTDVVLSLAAAQLVGPLVGLAVASRTLTRLRHATPTPPPLSREY